VDKELGRLPKTLKESYDVTYKRIEDSGCTSRAVAERVMKWLLCELRPLKTLEVVAAVSVDSEGQCYALSNTDLLNMCCNMVILDAELDVFRFAHLSVREYLEGRSDNINTEAHALAMERCLDTYLFELASRPRSEMTDEHNSVFRPYATLYWPVHCQRVGSGGLVGQPKEKLWQFLLQGCDAASSFTEWTSAARTLSQALNRDDSLKAMLAEVSSSPLTPLFLACCIPLSSIMDDLNTFENAVWNQRNYEGRTGLHLAARYGHEAMIKLLLEKGTDIAAKDRYRMTALHEAARHGHEATVRLLLARDNVEVNSKNMIGWTPLSFAAQYGHEAVVKLLLALNDIEVNSKDMDNRTPLSFAAESGHETVVELLLTCDDIEVNSKDIDNCTPLLFAAEGGHEVVVKLLLARDDIKVNSKAMDGRTPLSFAAKKGHEVVVKLLLARNDIEVNSGDMDNRTPLLFAVESGHEVVVKLLLARDDIEVNSKGTPVRGAEVR
jgi:ankyrin repeat protein